MLRHELLCHDSFLTDTEVDEEIADLRDRCRVERDALPASQTRYNEDIAALLREHLKRLSEWVQDYVGLYDYLETECNGVKAVLKLRAYPDHVTSRLAVTSLTASKQKKTR